MLHPFILPSRLLMLGLFLILVTLTTSGFAIADTKDKALKQVQQQLEVKLKQLHPSLAISSLEATPLAGFYAAELNSGDLLYLHQDGEFLFAGNLLQFTSAGLVDLTEAAAQEKRQQLLASINPQEQIIYPAKGETKAVVQVFTDTSCPFCNKLHQEVPKLNKLGVEVRYLAFPRQGVHSQAYQDLQTAWCSSNPAATLTAIKDGKKPKAATCDNPINKQYELGKRLGVQGTPAIFLPDGKLIPGYVKAESLVDELGI